MAESQEIGADEFKLARAYMAEPGRVEELIGRPVHPDAFGLEPQGSRLLVVADEPPEEYGRIKIPQEVKDAELVGAGTVIGVGPTAGYSGVPYPGGPSCHPSELLYRHIIFRKHAGGAVILDYVRDRDFASGILVLADRDIWCVDFRDDPWETQRKRRIEVSE